MTKTIEIKPRNAGELVKPKELIEMTELVPLSLTDRRIFNTLVKHAWADIEADTMHSIPKKILRSNTNATERLGQSIKRIMAVVIERKYGRNGIERFHLLTHNIEDDKDDDETLFHYTFPEPLRKIIRDSEVWARLESHVVYAFSSKYALALYELVALRSGMKHKNSEVIELEKFRALIGVEKDKLLPFKNFKAWAIEPAIREVNGLCPEFNVAVDSITTGRKVTAVKITWWPKSIGEKSAALREIGGSKIGRHERLSGIVELVVPSLPAFPTQPAQQQAVVAKKQPTDQDKHRAARTKLKRLHPGADVDAIYADFNRAVFTGQHPEPQNWEAAFIAFGRKTAAKAGV